MTNAKGDSFVGKEHVVGGVSKGVIRLGSVTAQNGGIKVTSNAIVGGPRKWVNDTGSNVVLQFYTKWIPVQA